MFTFTMIIEITFKVVENVTISSGIRDISVGKVHTTKWTLHFNFNLSKNLELLKDFNALEKKKKQKKPLKNAFKIISKNENAF